MVTDRIGLDIGRTSIKAVRFRRTLTGRKSVTYLQQDLTMPLGQEVADHHVAGLLRQFVETHRLTHADVVTAMPCQHLFVRTLTLPFDDPKRLAQVVPYEVESLIPLPVEEVVMDYQLIQPTGRNGSLKQAPSSGVLVAAAPRTAIAHHIRLLTEAGIEPISIDVDALALFSLARYRGRLGAEFPSDLAIIDIGASKTTLCLLRQGAPWMIRTILWGGNHLTRALADRYACSFADAELRKRELTAPHVEPWLMPLLQELRVTFHAYAASARTQLQHCWFSGGGSELKDLPGYLAHQLEVEPVMVADAGGAICPPAFSVAHGLAVKTERPGGRLRLGQTQVSVGIDLKQVDRATPAERKERQRDLWLAGVGGVTVLLLALTDLSVRVFLKESRVQELKAAAQAQFREQFPGIEGAADEVDLASSALAGIKKTIALLGGDQPQVLPLLAELIRRIPKSAVVKLGALTIDRATIQLEAETDSFESVEKIKQGLSAFPGAQDVSVSDARVGTVPNQVLFRVTMTLSPS